MWTRKVEDESMALYKRLGHATTKRLPHTLVQKCEAKMQENLRKTVRIAGGRTHAWTKGHAASVVSLTEAIPHAWAESGVMTESQRELCWLGVFCSRMQATHGSRVCYAENTGNMAVCDANARSNEKGSRWPHALAAKSVFNAARAWCASVCRGLGEGPSNSSAARALRHCTVRLRNNSACKTLLELVN